MRISKRILKAINEGVYRALADLDDEDEVVLSKSSIDFSRSSKIYEEYKFIDDNFVDLGLPSGTLWAQHNLGAICDSWPKSWYGDYYAWGETEPSEIYTEYAKKYLENPDQLPLSRDAANQILKNNCYMPSKEQIEELIIHTNSEWVINYCNVAGLNGRIFTGKTGNHIFIPASGYKLKDKTGQLEKSCYILSKTSDKHYYNVAYALLATHNNAYLESELQWVGYPIRAVHNSIKK